MADKTAAPAMLDPHEGGARFFVSYSGKRLPFNLINPIAPDALANRNTFIQAWFDETGALVGFDKLVYGEVELSHRYEYHDNGRLRRAEIAMLDEARIAVCFDEAGMQLS